ncbi:unnamed protein product [Caenorhabditis auriculariae]|uniref:Uncharacterized protein n=1 Tax=Caenorhabditis auriculariae TaxID=2777116 RepID=A0A8S1HSC4_9PELO|nr:unnamed protein product [Caenorhabditis auriculariae]
MNHGKPYSTWTFSMVLQRSTCKVRSTSLNALPNCKIDPTSPSRAFCKADLAWTDNDWETVEIETYCHAA